MDRPQNSRYIGCFGIVFCVGVFIFGLVFWGKPVTFMDYLGFSCVGTTLVGCLAMFIIGDV